MPISLDFAVTHRYDGPGDGITVPIKLSNGTQSVELLAKMDTGATYCIFERKYAEILGLEVESERFQRFRTVAGSFGPISTKSLFRHLAWSFPQASFSRKIRVSVETSSAGQGGLTAFVSALSSMTGCSSWARTNPETNFSLVQNKSGSFAGKERTSNTHGAILK